MTFSHSQDRHRDWSQRDGEVHPHVIPKPTALIKAVSVGGGGGKDWSEISDINGRNE